MARADSGHVGYAGGVPLHADGALVGSIGVSGGTAEQDEACVAAAVTVLGRDERLDVKERQLARRDAESDELGEPGDARRPRGRAAAGFLGVVDGEQRAAHEARAERAQRLRRQRRHAPRR